MNDEVNRIRNSAVTRRSTPSAGLGVAGELAGDHERDPAPDHHRVVGRPFVVATDERELHRHLERGLVDRPGEAREDRAEELLLEVVHHVVHVGQRGGDGGVLVGERVDGEARLHAGLARPCAR